MTQLVFAYVNIDNNPSYSIRKLSVDDEEDLVIALQNEISRSPESRYDHRLHGVLMVAKGMSCYVMSPRSWVVHLGQWNTG